MRTLQTAYRVFGWLKLAGALISGVAVLAMMLLIVADVVKRNFGDGSISGSFEIAQNYFLPLSVFPALGWVYASGVLPRMDLLVPRLAAPLRAAITTLVLLLELVIFSLVLYYSWGYAVDGMERDVAFPAGGTLYPLWPLFFLVPLGVGMVLVETLFALARNLLGPGVTLSMLEAEGATR